MEVKGLKKYYAIKRGLLGRTVGWVQAVDEVSLSIKNGETLGLVGESGCGKSTLGRALLRLEEPTAGEVLFLGENILDFNRERMRQTRREMQIIFQDPYASLDPRKTVGKIIEEPFFIHRIGNKRERLERVVRLMKRVGLRPEHYHRFPPEFSGGQRQRIGICQSPGPSPEIRGLRRTGLGAGCFHSIADSQFTGRPAGRVPAHLSVYRSRPKCGGAPERSGGGHVSGQVGGTGHK